MKKKTFLLILFILSNLFNFAQNDGVLDSSFGGYFSPLVSDRDDTLMDFLIDNENYIVSVGQTYYQGQNDFVTCSVSSEGNYNIEFGNNGIYHDTNIENGLPWKIEKLIDGYLVVGTYYTSISMTPAFAIVKYTNTGFLDASFATNGVLKDNMFSGSDIAISAKVLTNGKILIVGHNTEGVTLLMIDYLGNIDTTFGTNGRKFLNFPNSNRKFNINQMELTDNNKFLLIGPCSLNNTTTNEFDLYVARLNYDGSFDTSFGTSGVSILDLPNYNESYARLALYANGDYILVGTKQDDNDSNFSETILSKFDTNGNLITSFGTNGLISMSLINYSDALKEYVSSCVVDDNYIYVAGSYNITYSYSSYKGYVSKFDSNGVLVDTFANNGVLSFGNTMNYAKKIVFDNGNLVVGGIDTYSDDDFIFARVIINNTLNINDFNKEHTITYFPNPVKDKILINLDIDIVNEELKFVLLYDSNGKLVLERDIFTPMDKLELDLTSIPNGQYILVLNTINNNKHSIKIVKE